MGVSPSTKQTTLHHYREPVAAQLAADQDVDFLGVVLQASSEHYLHKRLVAKRTALMLSGMRADGIIVITDTWGNGHIDFAAVIEFAGDMGIPAVGVTFVGVQAAFVVTNPYMDSIVDVNKISEGCENCVVGENTPVELDAVKAVAILKNKMRKRAPERIAALNPAFGPVRTFRGLEVRSFFIKDVLAADKTRIEKNNLYLNLPDLQTKILTLSKNGEGLLRLVKDVKLSLVPPASSGAGETVINSLLDFSPVAVKVEGILGEGVTNLAQGVQMMLGAVDEGGFQPINGGAAKGSLKESVRFGRPGTPGADDFIIHVDVLLQKGEGCTRQGIMAAHLVCDIAAGEIRAVLRELNRYKVDKKTRFFDVAKPGLFRVALVQSVSGVSAMGDSSIFSEEPGGFSGSSSIMDLTHNLPVFLTANEYRDGIVHSLS